ncbi:hypothetical protein Dsin_022977 [Dipteronia sinensis]|uniref:Reverse transcriptase zinc-binding domain-containing protein n=1 Tax=Dipteronia sinensis TaxID=43782 RepID=A0AAE0A3D9_9ROSI|nr:hypothetical protein Dsin_022977 [Dipteronia sinensis]
MRFSTSSVSPFVKVVGSLLMEDSNSARAFKEEWKVIIGKEDMAHFWDDIVWDSVPLNEAFPRIYALSCNKPGLVQDFGSWVGSCWVWKILLRRSLFDWEFEQWNCLHVLLNNIGIRNNISNSVAWTLSPHGSFTVWSFRRRLEDYCSGVSPISSLLWHGICPPKVEILVWQILKGRVMVKEVLCRFGVTFGGNQLCPLCNSVVESVDHLFLLCHRSWKIW